MELDERKAENVQCTAAPSLLPHNEPVYGMLEHMLADGNKAIIVSATGTGKSYIAAKYIAEHGEKAVVVCPKRSVMQSWESLVPGIDTMTYHYLCRMKPGDLMALPYTCWVFDEAHHCCSTEWRKNIEFLMNHATGSKFIGLTADPVRHLDGGLDVSQELFDGNVVDGLDLHKAIQKNVLPPFTYVSTVFGLGKAMDEAKTKAATPGPNRYLVAEKITRLQDSLQNMYRIGDILSKHMPEGKRKCVVFVDQISSLPEAMDIMRDWSGNDAEFLTMHSNQPAVKNNAAMERFREMEEGYVFAVDMLNEGLHFPGVNTVIMFRHTESPNLYFQQLGRGLAANGGNPVIFDFVGNRKSLTTKSSSGGRNCLTGNYSEWKAQPNVILYDYATEALDLLDEINDLLNGQWTDGELDILRKYYPEESKDVAKRLPGRSPKACVSMARRLGIFFLYKEWSKEEINILQEFYPSEGRNVANRLPGRSPSACGAMATKLKLKWISSQWSEEETDILQRFYPSEGTNVAQRLPDRSPSACKAMAGKLGLHKDFLPKEWSEEEINIFRNYYPKEGKMVVKRLPGRTPESCRNMARKLGVYSKRATAWTKEEINILMQYYPVEGGAVVQRLPGRTINACRGRAHILGLSFQPTE